MKNEMKITPVATMRNFTQADTAKEMRDSIKIHIPEHNTMGITIHKCGHNQPLFASPACRLNKSKQGSQVTADSSNPSTASFPKT
jgi:hypothetical protein